MKHNVGFFTLTPHTHPSLSLPQYKLLAKHTEKEIEDLERDLVRPKYLNPFQAVNYGVIDRVLAPDEDEAREMVRSATFNTDRA